MISNRQATNRIVIVLLLIMPVCLITGIVFAVMFPGEITSALCYTTFLLTSLEMIVLLLILLVAVQRCGGLRRVVNRYMIREAIDNNLLAIGAYVKPDDGRNIVITPKVSFDRRGNIVIHLSNMNVRQKIESRIDVLSTALPENMICRKAYLDKSGKVLTIEYDDLTSDRTLVFSSLNDYRRYVRSFKKTVLVIDDKTTIDLRKHTGLLITGSPGSGKSYFVRELIIQGLIKKYDIRILDRKATYQMFRDRTTFVTRPDAIIEELEEISREIDTRAEAMDQILVDNPNAVACDYGFPVMIVVIEEYLALSADESISSKEMKHIESLIKRITTMGRQLSIHPIIVMQVSSADALNSDIRGAIPVRMVFGVANETIYRTAFGLSNVPKIAYKFEPGEGLGMIDGDQFMYRIPEIQYSGREINEI